MAKGLSLSIGLNSVNPKHYANWEGKLNACENDVDDLIEIMDSQGFESNQLKTSKATFGNVVDNVTEAIKILKPGDTFVFTYAGQGGQLPDLSNISISGELMTVCLFDRQMLQVELLNLFEKFVSGVRVFVILDKCHSGTVAKASKIQCFRFTQCSFDKI